MAQENEQLEEAFASDDMVTVCWEPACHMHRLYYWPEEKWVEHNKKTITPNIPIVSATTTTSSTTRKSNK